MNIPSILVHKKIRFFFLDGPFLAGCESHSSETAYLPRQQVIAHVKNGWNKTGIFFSWILELSCDGY